MLLDDGTAVYLNRNTAVAYECRGELTFRRGEIDVERQLSPLPDAMAKDADEKPPGFVINLPNGEVMTRGAKVDLRIEADGVRMVVVRGKVFVGDTPIFAGQSYVYHGDRQIAGSRSWPVDRPLAAIAWTCGTQHLGSPPGAGLWQAMEDSASAPLPPLARDWIFLVDCCGDRTPRLARAQIEIVRNLMDIAEEGDTAALIVGGVRPQVLAGYRLEATPETTRRMVEMLEPTHLVGGLNLQRAIEAAQPYFAAAGNPVLVHVGTGHASLGQCDPTALLAKIPASVRTIGIDVTAEKWPEWIAAAAGRPGGRVAKIDPQEDIRGQIMELLDAMEQLPSSAGRGTHDHAAHDARPEGEGGLQSGPEGNRHIDASAPHPGPLPEGEGDRTQPGRPRYASFARACAGLLPPIPRHGFALHDLQRWKDLMLAGWQWHSGRLADADERFQHLLADPEAARCRMVWWLAARLADERGRFGRASACWEKILTLERARPTATPCVDAVRRDYGGLLDEYRKLAQATAGLSAASTQDLIMRVISAADRWRLLDSDPTPACYAAARALADLGASEEAWEYVTTPPDWKKLAARLEKEGYGGIMEQE